MKAFKVLLAGAVLLALMMFFASPYWVLYQINRAYQHNDASGIAKYIDFVQVKQSLQPQIQHKIDHAARLDHLPGALQKWGSQLSAAVSAQAADAVVNEHSIFLLMQGKSLKESLQQSMSGYSAKWDAAAQQGRSEHLPAVNDSLHNDANDNADGAVHRNAGIQPQNRSAFDEGTVHIQKPRLQAHYTGWNRFEIAAPNDSGKLTRFELERSKFSWKIVDIRLPNE